MNTHNNAFTLLECLISMGLIVGLLLITVPAGQRLLHNAQLHSQGDLLLLSLKQARLLALGTHFPISYNTSLQTQETLLLNPSLSSKASDNQVLVWQRSLGPCHAYHYSNGKQIDFMPLGQLHGNQGSFSWSTPEHHHHSQQIIVNTQGRSRLVFNKGKD